MVQKKTNGILACNFCNAQTVKFPQEFIAPVYVIKPAAACCSLLVSMISSPVIEPGLALPGLELT
jgi:hypothetical protein